MVGDHNELGVGVLHGRESRCQRRARVREVRAVEDFGRTVNVADGVLLVDESGADDVVTGCRNRCGRRYVRPISTIRVQRFNKLLDRVVTVLTEVRRVFDLLESNHGCIQLVDRINDLGLLLLEAIRIEGAAHLAAVGGRGVAFAVGVRLALRVGVTQSREVVQHVERCHGDIGSELRRSLTYVRERNRHVLGTDLLLSWLQAPLVEAVVQNDALVEGRFRTDRDRVVKVEVRQRRLFCVGVLHVVPGGTVVKQNGPSFVVLDLSLCLG